MQVELRAPGRQLVRTGSGSGKCRNACIFESSHRYDRVIARCALRASGKGICNTPITTGLQCDRERSLCEIFRMVVSGKQRWTLPLADVCPPMSKWRGVPGLERNHFAMSASVSEYYVFNYESGDAGRGMRRASIDSSMILRKPVTRQNGGVRPRNLRGAGPGVLAPLGFVCSS